MQIAERALPPRRLRIKSRSCLSIYARIIVMAGPRLSPVLPRPNLRLARG